MNAHAVVDYPPVIATTLRSPAREALRSAIAHRGTAAARLATATETAARARTAAGDVEQRLAAIGDVDADILAHHSAAYRAWAESGGDKPSADTPPALAERQRARDAARDEAAAAAAAAHGLEAARAAAVAALNAAEQAVHDAAKAVLVEQADALLAKFDEARRAALALHDDISALAMLQVQRGTQSWAEGRLALPPATHRTITTPMDWRPGLPGNMSYPGQQLPKWMELFEALKHDADAESPD